MKTFTPDSSVVSDVIPSPNFGDRNKGRAPDMIVLHYTGMPDVEGALARLCQAGTEVSAHYVVLEDGRIVQCVPEAKRAWHAGVSYWAGEEDINSCSIGIEIVNRGHDWGYPDFPLRQVAATIALCRGIIIRRGVRPHRVLGAFRRRARAQEGPRREISLARAVGFRRRTLGAAGADRARRCDEARCRRRRRAGAAAARWREYGYGLTPSGHYNAATAEVVTAFQRHFRPQKVDGVADTSTLATLHALLSGLPARQAMQVAADVSPDGRSSGRRIGRAD